MLETYRTSGSVSCSQDSWTLSAPPKSPIFPKSSSDLTFHKSPVFSETDHGDSGENELSPDYCRSPVFGRNTQHKKSLSPHKPQVSDCNSGITLSSQESLTSSVRSASCRPQSPVFPRSPNPPENLPPPERSASCKSPASSGTDGGQSEQSPVFGRSGQPQKSLHSQDLRTVSSAVRRSCHRFSSNLNVIKLCFSSPYTLLPAFEYRTVRLATISLSESTSHLSQVQRTPHTLQSGGCYCRPAWRSMSGACCSVWVVWFQSVQRRS